MSVPVDLDALGVLVDELGPEALLTTITRSSTPHVVSVLVTWVDGHLNLGGGRRTQANIAVNPRVTVIWPRVREDAYRLIVDGIATGGDDEPITITPTFAILHRIAGIEVDGPNCVPIERA